MEKYNFNKQNTPAGVPSSGARGLKINWGTGIVIAFAIFISFILFFIIKVQSNPKYDNELVIEEYYKNDAKFGDEMIRVQNAQDLKQKPAVATTPDGIRILFPVEFSSKAIKGKVRFYRPSNKKFDFEVPILLSNSSMQVSKDKLLGGRWDINMEWEYQGKQYLSKEVIYY